MSKIIKTSSLLHAIAAADPETLAHVTVVLVARYGELAPFAREAATGAIRSLADKDGRHPADRVHGFTALGRGVAEVQRLLKEHKL